MTKKKASYIFTLKNINLEKIHNTYGFDFSIVSKEEDEKKSSKEYSNIDQLININSGDPYSFIDESGKKRTCKVTMIDFKSAEQLSQKNYHCYWDRNPIPSNIKPIGCPIRYIPNKINKTYYSEISKNVYNISENVTKQKLKTILESKDPRFSAIMQDYYLTYGIFCSFNCCMAFIEENKEDYMYIDSELLLIQMYNELYGEESDEIIPAPHWETLSEYGGYLNIEEFRKLLGRRQFTCHGKVNCISIGKLYESVIKV